MRFADPNACPDCRGALAGDSRCPHCGLDLTSPAVRQLWQVLLQADSLLAHARRVPAQSPGAPPPPPPPPPPSQAPTAAAPPPGPSAPAFRPYPAAGPAESARAPRQWSVGTILLALGAFGLVVAGFIFVTRSWGDLGLVGRTLVLCGVTGLIGGLAAWVTHRPLRASAEAVWTVFLALLTLDFFAARHVGMLGLDAQGLGWSWLVWGIVLVGTGVGIVVWSRRPIGADLVAPAVIAGGGLALAGAGVVVAPDDQDFFWRVFAALVVVGVVGLAIRPARVRLATLAARVVTAAFFLFAYGAALVDLADHPAARQLIADGHGLPMLLMAGASIAVAAAVHVVRIPAVALAVVAGCLLVLAPVDHAWSPEGTWLAVAGLATILTAASMRGTDDWMRGVRLGAAFPVVVLVALLSGFAVDLLDALSRSLDDPWTRPGDARLDLARVEDTTIWPVALVAVAALAVTWCVSRWPEVTDVRTHTGSALAVVGAVGAADVVVGARLPLWWAVVVLLLAAVALTVFAQRVASLLAGPAAVVLVALAAGLSAASHGVSAAGWSAGALVLAAVAVVDRHAWVRRVAAGGAVVLLTAGLAAGVSLTDWPDAIGPLVVLVVGLALLGAAGRWLREPLRLAVESTAAVAVVVSLVADGSSGELAVRWTIAGAAVIALSFVVSDRRWYLWPGAIALVVAYVLVIIDSGFSFVEAYTLPLGALALAAGLYWMRRQPPRATWLLLGPGLALALLPSIPQALADPTGLRALLLGTASLVALGVGIKVGWQAPFVSGVMVLTLLVLANIGPYANSAPRVILIAVVSAILLGVGITWEDRVRDGRRLVSYVRSMR